MIEYERGGDHRVYDAYALGYYHGRTRGDDETWPEDFAARGWDPQGYERAAYKDGYERGVDDYSTEDAPDAPSEADMQAGMPGQVRGLLPPAGPWVCEGYNVAGRWVDCDRPEPHGHGILADMLEG